MNRSLREIANSVNKTPGATSEETELYNLFKKITDSGTLLRKAGDGNYSHREYYMTFRKFRCPDSSKRYIDQVTTKNLVPFANYTISEGGITASLELNYDRDSEQYEWFLSHERTSKYYDPHIDIYMVFKW